MKSRTSYHSKIRQAEMDESVPELDLHGYTRQEAEIEIDQFFGQQLFFDIEVVKLIHGRGGGVLERFIGEYLKRHKAVAYFESSTRDFEIGGVTYVVLK